MPFDFKKGITIMSLAALALTASGCRLVSQAEFQAAQAPGSASAFGTEALEERWESEYLPYLRSRAVEADALWAALAESLPAAGERYGEQPGLASPWTFVLSADVTVTGKDLDSRTGSVAVEARPDGASRSWTILTGPVLIEMPIRDALPSITYNDVDDQVVYAEIGAALNEKALQRARPVLAEAEVGDTLRLLGAFSLDDPAEGVRIVPIELTRAE